MYSKPERSYSQRLAEDGDTNRFAYKANQAYETLKPYLAFLRRIQAYYEKNSPSIPSRRAPHDYSKNTTGFWIDVDNESILQKIDEGEIREVYEFDPEEGLPPKRIWDSQYKIEITDRDVDEMRVRLKRKPAKPRLKIKPNLVHIIRELRAINEIANNPERPDHDGLLMLFHGRSFVKWPDVGETDDPEWLILTEDVEGADEQRRFVKTAMATPDFAFLSGPPGSGKTTAICELVLQLAAKGKRMLFCASTHVAIDNLLERLVDDNGSPAKNLLPIRIGVSPKISDLAKPFFYNNFVSTKTKSMERCLKSIPDRTDSQNAMLDSLRHDDTVGEMARRYANFICGTPIGLASYFKREQAVRFDYLITDEASKTTFHEFLVPALRARRWIIVGDTRQLVPHTDQEEIAANVNACLPDVRRANACLDVFAAKKYGNTTMLVTGNEGLLEVYRKQCKAFHVEMDESPSKLGHGRIVVCGAESVPVLLTGSKVAWAYARRSHKPARGRVVVRDYEQTLEHIPKIESIKQGLKLLKNIEKGQSELQGYTWGHELGWRIAVHQPRIQKTSSTLGDRIHDDIQTLLPVDGDGGINDSLNDIRRVALPSILELMQQGYDPDGRDAALVRGMPADAFNNRHILLSYQHRMHPDIARFPHRHMYDSHALKSPPAMVKKREWGYNRYPGRCVWVDVGADAHQQGSDRTNIAEARCIEEEVRQFYQFAAKNPKKDGAPWEVAVLTFYTHQRRTLQQVLARAFGGGIYTFRVPQNMPRMVINLRTVDSFQGHESDIVFISMTKPHPTPFLNNPNRLNVALTRARYQCVIVGDKKLAGGDPPLGALAGETTRARR